MQTPFCFIFDVIHKAFRAVDRLDELFRSEYSQSANLRVQ